MAERHRTNYLVLHAMSYTREQSSGEGVIARRLTFCPRLQGWPIHRLIRKCPDCKDFVLHCCACEKSYETDIRPCHHYRLVFTDGACLSNGQFGAAAGVGVAVGEDERSQLAKPVDDELDAFPKRTSQRAELLAALEGLRFITMIDHLNSKKHTTDSKEWVITTDSEYVVKGMTEWLPAWKVSFPYTRDLAH